MTCYSLLVLDEVEADLQAADPRRGLHLFASLEHVPGQTEKPPYLQQRGVGSNGPQ